MKIQSGMEKTKMIDKSKTYLFDGETGRVLTTIRNNSIYPVVWETSEGLLKTLTIDGRHITNGPIRLVEAKPTRWINVYPSCEPSVHHPTREQADRCACSDRIACIEFKEGAGL